MIIDSIRNFIRNCPHLQEFDGIISLNVDYLGDDTSLYSIEEVPCVPIIKSYINGDSIRQYQFTFCSREPYGSDVLQNISNSTFYEDFANWIEKQNKIKDLPLLDKGMKSKSIEVLTGGYAVQASEHKARYQIDLVLKYFKKDGVN